MKDKKNVLPLIAQNDTISDSCLFHFASPVLLVMVGSHPLNPPDRRVPGNDDDKLIPQRLCLIEKVDMPGMKMIKGARAHNSCGH